MAMAATRGLTLLLIALVLAQSWHPFASSAVFVPTDAIEVLRDEAAARLDELGKISDAEGFLQRTFLSPAALRAGALIQEWMRDAGLYTWMDTMGNIHGRADCANASAPALLFGSHMDTVVDAGKYDGPLGIVTAIAAVKMLKRTGKLESFVRPIEIIAFSDEEGVRFQSTFLGSGAIAGILPPEILFVKDKSGVTVENSLKSWSLEGTPESLAALKYDPESVWGYVEVHIEQGPALEAQGVPVGIVEAIAGQTRYRVSLRGQQGHAGTVPMELRKDPMPAAAQAIVGMESLCKENAASGGLVCTVGEISTWPGASNVIPGEVTFTIDLRAKDDSLRERIASEVENSIKNICRERKLSCTVQKMHEARAVSCDKNLMHSLKRAAESALIELKKDEAEVPVPSLMSGAGHDAMAIAKLTKVGMLFVRCEGGISHSPAESVSKDDILAAGLSILHFLNDLSEEGKGKESSSSSSSTSTAITAIL